MTENINNILKMGNMKRKKIKIKENLQNMTIKDDYGFVRIDPRFLANI